ncbi:MAG: biopolymer transporter ExbD [Phycisphaerae bacterium]|nr:biopolymer transporter ExbD [Saprospiraceae bacterium]
MADFQASAQSNVARGKPRSHRMSTRIDFTPMVDLGFLLITFFMLTTALAKPSVMPLVMPKDDGTTEPIKQSKVLTFLLGADDKVYWYEGLDIEKMDSTTFDADGLRQVILRKKEKVETQFGLQKYTDSKTGAELQGSQLNVIIKPANSARYKNLVDALDEMAICQVRYYCVMEISAEEVKRFE